MVSKARYQGIRTIPTISYSFSTSLNIMNLPAKFENQKLKIEESYQKIEVERRTVEKDNQGALHSCIVSTPLTLLNNNIINSNNGVQLG